MRVATSAGSAAMSILKGRLVTSLMPSREKAAPEALLLVIVIFGSRYKEKLKPLQGKRIVFIFDECHRSQFGENHKAIKEFFPNAQLFGFTGTPIFPKNATYKQIEEDEASLKTTLDIEQDHSASMGYIFYSFY
jgi:hypothetical protein